MSDPPGNAHQSLKDTSSRKAAERRKKGQPEGYAVKGKTGKPWVAGTDRKTWNATGRNNSNLTPYAASVASGEWELLLGIVPIIVL